MYEASPVIDQEIDLYRAAKLYIDQHGDHAAMRADALLDTGDPDGAATWRKIIKAIEVSAAVSFSGRIGGRLWA